MRKFANAKSQKPTRQALRNNMPYPEQKLWYYLRKKFLGGYKFRRQYGIGSFVVDFYCPKAKLAIELDGNSHYEPGAQTQDAKRDEFIRSHGITVLRFTNNDIRDSLDEVVRRIKERLTPSISPSVRGRKA